MTVVDDARGDVEDAVRSCYSTWGTTYYDDYYGEGAPYPPVHRDLVVRLLREHNATTVLDAGCGPASMLRDLPPDLDRYGFDLTPEMVREAKRVMEEQGVPGGRVWEGSVADPGAFVPPGDPVSFDAALCIGVLPHVPPDLDERVVANLSGAVRPGGLVIAEARNELFSLFTLNRYSSAFVVDRLLPVDRLRELAQERGEDLDGALSSLVAMFRNDLPPVRTGKAGEPGYDEVLARTHNPFELRAAFEGAGFVDVRVHFYHYHALPPLAADRAPEAAARASVEMEDPTDWRGHFMASAFMVSGCRP